MYVITGVADEGGAEAINGLIEFHRRAARGFRIRDDDSLRMILIGGDLLLTPNRQVRRATVANGSASEQATCVCSQSHDDRPRRPSPSDSGRS